MLQLKRWSEGCKIQGCRERGEKKPTPSGLFYSVRKPPSNTFLVLTAKAPLPPSSPNSRAFPPRRSHAFSVGPPTNLLGGAVCWEARAGALKEAKRKERVCARGWELAAPPNVLSTKGKGVTALAVRVACLSAGLSLQGDESRNADWLESWKCSSK